MNSIRIRPYDPADLTAVVELFNGSVRKIASRDYSPAQIEAWAPVAVNLIQWSERLERKPTFIAEHMNRIAGFSDLGPTGHIDMLFVHCEHQGRGVAKSLMDHILLKAHEQKLSSLCTDASITAKPFFERSGFKVAWEQDVELRGQIFRNYRMIRVL